MNIDASVLSVLSRSTCAGALLTLPGQLERSLYVSTNKVLEALDAKWSRKDKAHVFTGDAAEQLDAVLLTGSVALPETFGYFPTPIELVEQLVDVADVCPTHRVLEPSAGTGAIARYMQGLDTVKVACIELQPKFCKVLWAAGLTTVEGDFLKVPPRPVFDRVVMNPPFARRADIHHVRHAAQFLRTGGRLAAIMSAGVLFREDRLAHNFREFVRDQDGTIEPLPPQSFRSSGTDVNTVMVSFSY